MAAEPSETVGFSLDSFRRIGPAFVLAAATIGPGTITVYSLSGATFGYSLLWLFPIAGLFAAVYVEMLARLGIVSELTLWDAVRDRFGPAAGIVGGVVGLATALGYQTGNVTGAGLGIQAFTGVDATIWSSAVAAVAIGFLWIKDLYDRLERLILALVALMLVGFLASLTAAGFDPGAVAGGFVPAEVPTGRTLWFVLLMTATYFSLYGVVYQSYLVDEKGYTRADLPTARYDAVAAMAVLGLLGMMILLTAAAVLPRGADDVAQLVGLLQPAVGDAAALLFGLGLFASSFSSVVANALIGAVLLTDGLGYSPSFDGRPTKYVATAITAAGWLLAVGPQVLGADPIDTILLAQGVSVIALPYFGAVALLVCNDSTYLGRHTNSTATNVVAVLGYLLTIGVTAALLRTVLSNLGVL